jgi:hypothetical protein
MGIASSSATPTSSSGEIGSFGFEPRLARSGLSGRSGAVGAVRAVGRAARGRRSASEPVVARKRHRLEHVRGGFHGFVVAPRAIAHRRLTDVSARARGASP